MLEQIFSNYNFKQLHNFLEKLNSEIIEETIAIERKENSINNWINVNAKLKNDLNLKILTLDNPEEIWITFYFEIENINLEQISFMMLKDTNKSENNFIWHDYFIRDNDTAITVNSSYDFYNDSYVDGVEQIRKVYFKDIARYAGKDNLANLTVCIDNSKDTKVLYMENKENIIEEPNIEAMVLKDQAQVIKVLVKK